MLRTITIFIYHVKKFVDVPASLDTSFQITNKSPLHPLHYSFRFLLLQQLLYSMAPQRVYFDSLVPRSRHHSVRAKVISKKSGEGKQKYQRLLLVDEKGLTMKAVLFGHNVDYFDEIFSEDQCYDMSNLVVSAVDKSFQSYPDEKQIHINTSSSIKKVDVIDSSTHFNSKFSKISELPRDLSPYNATFDMIVVVLHFTPSRKVHNKFSCSESVLLSLWNEFALACKKFGDTDPCGVVISLTGLKIKDFKGFSLSTNYHSKINFNPIGTRADALRKWFEENRETILTTTGIINLKKENLSTDIPITTIEHAMEIKAADITTADVVKIAAYVPDFTLHCLRLTVSCNLCAKVCDVPPGASYVCDKCQNNAISTAKMFFDFTTTDGTGTLKLATNSKTAEQLLKIKPADLYNMSNKEHASFTDEICIKLRRKKTEMILSPIPSLLKAHNKLVWRLKEIL